LDSSWALSDNRASSFLETGALAFWYEEAARSTRLLLSGRSIGLGVLFVFSIFISTSLDQKSGSYTALT
jgi:hypothetical protein